MSGATNPFLPFPSRPSLEGDYTRSELALAYRNSGLPLEALEYDVTPVGLHYTLTHFDIPRLNAADYRLTVKGRVAWPLTLSLEEIRALPASTQCVTLECAGNGRGFMQPRSASMPWLYEAVGTAEWTGTSLRNVLDRSGVLPGAVDIAFFGADRGFDRGVEHNYGRSLKPDTAAADEVLLAWAMNGAPLAPQHGFPLRLVVPGWYGMASVKWLSRIEVLPQPFDGQQQAVGYHYRKHADDAGVAVTFQKVKSLMVPPGIPDWYSRRRLVECGSTRITGRAWSGAGLAVSRLEVAVDGVWRDAHIEPQKSHHEWQGWRYDWRAEPGEHELACRATDAAGTIQPLDPPWNVSGMGNNAVQRVAVTVQ